MIVHCSYEAMENEVSLVGACTVVITCHVTNACSLLVRTLRDTFTVKTDDSIEQFTQAFAELKARFRERMDLDSWKIASTMKDGVVQLVTKIERLKEVGEFGMDITRIGVPIDYYSRR
jgi:hypothetical protein